ncbi:unnamed protein product [Didymodactylos carnosus]|uniref:Uncharacterized protein n=1 Tax=Didymodactylos carnosus TaxID=1234261 RepID=A0A816CTK0_9BILA|nr:unnamed protein product [Didymodactylos carnosus]CAF4523898.1 unnamed protein product [Didymodactylos carnosus]
MSQNIPIEKDKKVAAAPRLSSSADRDASSLEQEPSKVFVEAKPKTSVTPSLASILKLLDSSTPLCPLLQTWIWKEWIEGRGDIFNAQDEENERKLNNAIAQLTAESKLPTDLSNEQKTILTHIQEFWSQVPDQRFGQFLSNYVVGHFLAQPPKTMLQKEDAQILAILKEIKSAQPSH